MYTGENMQKLKVYGIKNCDTVKKALVYLASKNYGVEFYDYKKTPPTKEFLKKWQSFLGELPINKKGTTYRKLGVEFEKIKNLDQQIQFLIENSSMIVRPIIEDEKSGKVLSLGKDFEKL